MLSEQMEGSQERPLLAGEGLNPDHLVRSVTLCGRLHGEGKRKQSEKGQKGARWTRPAQHLTAHLTVREGALVFLTRRGAPRSGWKAPCPGGPRIRVWS